jgi:hypothetical protein
MSAVLDNKKNGQSPPAHPAARGEYPLPERGR